jgi:hypothetical protein
MKQPSAISLSAALGLAAAILDPPHARANGPGGESAPVAQSMKLNCSGRLGVGQSPPAFGSDLSFEVSVSFGEGEILALVDPETKAVERTLYDAESTYGSLRVKDGSEATVVWTRTSGAAGPLLGQAIASDGDVIALSIGRAPEGSSDRPFVLFAAASASVYRGTCGAQSD